MADIQARRKALEEWLELRKRCPWPEQQRYEVLRSVVLFGQSPAERALETGDMLPLSSNDADEGGCAPLKGNSHDYTGDCGFRSQRLRCLQRPPI